jgi:hypothetical protein
MHNDSAKEFHHGDTEDTEKKEKLATDERGSTELAEVRWTQIR